MHKYLDNGFCPFCNNELKFINSVLNLKHYRCTICAKRNNINFISFFFKKEQDEKDYILRGISGLSNSLVSCYFKDDKWMYGDFEITWSTIPELIENIRILDLFN
jgi:hypothetical protein